MAIRIIQRRFGGPETLEVVEVESPTASDLGPDEVFVAVAAAGVNPIDVMTRTGGGMAATGAITLPFTPGWDVAGTVRAVGAGATGLAPGQRVLGLARFPREGAAYVERVIVPAADLVPTLEILTDEQAGAFPMAAMTAWQAFTDTASVEAGQRVLITGAGVRYAATHVHTQREWLERVVALAASGDLVPHVSASFALTEAAAAHRALEQGHTTGKIVLTC